jgi:predicted  nucleic acid-binding Zn-ribbon protein
MSNNQPANLQPSLIVGMGGTGAQILGRIKSLLLAEAPQLLFNESNRQGKVKLLALDLRDYSPVEHAPLDRGSEYLALGVGLPVDEWIDNQFRTSQSDFGIKDQWLLNADGTPYRTGIGRIVDGTGQIRGVGRAATFNEASRLYDTFGKIFADFFDVSQDSTSTPEVYFCTSLTGGTGSSMIFDIPYLVREAALSKVPTRTIFMYGHFILATAFQHVLPQQRQKFDTLANCYTALKELDYFANYPEWRVNYTASARMVDANGKLTENATKAPYDFMYLYHSANDTGFQVSNPDTLMEISALAISFGILTGLTSRMISKQVNTRAKSGINSRGKRTAYSAVGIACMELPKEQLIRTLGYRWASTMAANKANNPQAAAMEWDEARPLLDSIFTQSFPLYEQTGGQWVEKDEATLKDQWENLANRFGLEPFTPELGNIQGRMIEDYGRRIEIAAEFENTLRQDLDKYNRLLEGKASEIVARLLASLEEQVAGTVSADGHSTDAVAGGCNFALQVLRKMDALLSTLDQEASETIAATEMDRGRGKISQSRLGIGGGREKQATAWYRANYDYAEAQAKIHRVARLRQCLEQVRNQVSRLQNMVIVADKKLERFAEEFSGAAVQEMTSAIGTQSQRVTTEFLVQADQFQNHLVQYNLGDYSAQAFSNIAQRANTECGTSFLHLLSADSASEERAREIWLGEARKAAAQAFQNETLGSVVSDWLKTDDGRSYLLEKLSCLNRKAAPWLTSRPELLTGTDELDRQHYVLFPKSAKELDALWSKMEASGKIQEPIDKNQRELHPLLGERVVRITINHCFALEALTFTNKLRDNELELMKQESRAACPRQYSIFRNYAEFPDPSGPPPLTPEKLEYGLRYFALGNMLKLIQRTVSVHGSEWAFVFPAPPANSMEMPEKPIPLPRKIRAIAEVLATDSLGDLDTRIEKELQVRGLQDPAKMKDALKSYVNELANLPDEQERTMVHQAVVKYCQKI